MTLYIDETENEKYFIVAGLLTSSDANLELAYKKFKKAVSKYPISSKAKQQIFLEFKSTAIDYRFQKIKLQMLKEINALDDIAFFSCYVKKQKSMKQPLKEAVYITL